MTEQIGITVILSTLNRSECLHRTILELLGQKYASLEILVVDQSDCIDDEVVRLAAAHPRVISYHHVNFRGLPTARNYGWKHAGFDAILFLDDDIHCLPGLIQAHARGLSQPDVGIVGGAVEEARDDGRPRSSGPTGVLNRFTGVPTRMFHVHGEFEVEHVQGCNFSVWRKVLEDCNGVDEILNAGAALYEETDLCLRAGRLGYRIMFSGAARIVHLGVPRGGCRVPAWEEYVWGMAHNRAVLVQRHLRLSCRAIAMCRLFATGVSFGFRKRDPRMLRACVAGAIRGIFDARKAN